MTSPRSARRFEALDGWRGVFALLVAIMHLEVFTHWHDLSLVRESYLAVDFFFVLSGFVIGHATHGKLLGGRDVGVFAIRRWGRVWPMHVAVLAGFVAFEGLKLYLQSRGQQGEVPAFAYNTMVDPRAIPLHLTLTHSMQPTEDLTWNTPSWSISCEFYTYLVFAISSLWARRRMWLASLIWSASAGVLLWSAAPVDMNVFAWRGCLRCLYGFFAGYLVYCAYLALPALRARVATALELACVIGAFSFIAYAGPTRWSLLAPLIFTLPIWVFAQEQGRVSRVMKTAPLQALGRWSYSIYLLHSLVYFVSYRVMHTLGHKRGVPVSVIHGTWRNMGPKELIFLGNHWLMDGFALLNFMVVVGLAALCYRWLELPAQRVFQGWARGVRDPAPRPTIALELDQGRISRP